MRIAWFSPLPPARTDIAQYTARVLPALCERAEVTLWTDQAEWDVAIERLAPVERFDPANPNWPRLNESQAAFYNIGNDARFHSAIWEICRRRPGFAVMHDVFLHDSFSYHYKTLDDRDSYLRVLGEAGRRDAELHWDNVIGVDQMAEKYSCAPYVLESSLGAIVHSKAAERTLLSEVDLPVECLRLPYPVPEAPSPAAASPPWRLVVFGFLGRNRCLEPLLRALESLNSFHLDIYGELNDRSVVMQIQDRVTIHGFVPEAQLDAAIASAHLAINLRYPTKGEASGSQLRIWSHGVPSMVTQTGWYEELPDYTVVFVRPETMVEDIRARLAEFAAAPKRFAHIGIKGYQYFAKQHSPEQYADDLVRIAAQSQRYHRRWSALRLADQVAAGLEGWFDSRGVPGYVDRLAREIHGLSGFKS